MFIETVYRTRNLVIIVRNTEENAEENLLEIAVIYRKLKNIC